MARFSRRSLEGEILIDHRASPGLTAEQVGGFDAPVVGKGEVYESGVAVCAHCQYAVVLQPLRTRERHVCSKCDEYICDECAELLHVTLRCMNFRDMVYDHKNAVTRYGESFSTSPLLIAKLP